MKIYRNKFEHDPLVKKVLRTMPKKYDHMVVSIMESHETELFLVVELQIMIRNKPYSKELGKHGTKLINKL